MFLCKTWEYGIIDTQRHLDSVRILSQEQASTCAAILEEFTGVHLHHIYFVQ
jgi:hypothetical protein